MNEELLQAMLRIKDGTATQADYQLYETSLNGGKALASSAYKNRQTPTTKYSDIVEKISRGEATPQEISEYQTWAESENTKRGYINFDPVFGGDVSGTIQNTDNTFSGGQALVPTPVRTPNSAVPSWVTNPLGLLDKEFPDEPFVPFDPTKSEESDAMAFFQAETQKLKDEGKLVTPGQNSSVNNTFKTQPFLPYLYPGGSDLSTELYSFGRAIGAPKGAQGRLATGIGAGGAAALDIARNVMSGIGYEKANSFAEDWYRKRLQDQEYESQSQTRDTNNVGFKRDGGPILAGDPPTKRLTNENLPAENYPQDNMLYPPGDNRWDRSNPPLNMDIWEMFRNQREIDPPQELPENDRRMYFRRWENDARTGKLGTIVAENGGSFNGVSFEMGGEQMMSEGQEQMPTEVAPQEQQVDPIQQVVEIVTQLLQQGAPQEQIIQALVQQGIPQEQAVQIINQVMQQMQPQQTTKDGKTVNAQPGQQITFKHGGKKVSGTVKEIRDGKIILE